MSLSVPQPTKTTVRRRRVAPTSLAPTTATLRPHTSSVEYLAEDRPSVHTGRIFQALLGVAACLALTGVVAQGQDATTPVGSPDAPPPAVFVQAD